jgi:hypothetical protein
MSNMTGNDPTASTPPEAESDLAPGPEPDAAQSGEDPGYLTESGQAVGEDGSVVPIIGGLPAAEGSTWDIGAPLDDRGPGLAEEQSDSPDQVSHQDPSS